MVKITEVSLRDGHQSLLATRMRTEDMTDAAKIFDEIGFHSVEVWGGATYDTCLRYLKEDPFERLATFKSIFQKTPLQMLLRGQNLVGYRHYADDVVREFIRLSSEAGIDIYRIFDALNDIRNLKVSVEEVKKQGKHAQCAISYTISPVHTVQNYVKLAKDMVKLGADSICIKDMAGLLTPYGAHELIKALKEEIEVPLQLHAHSTAGFAFATHLKAVEAGVDIIDLANSALAEGTSHPCTQSMVATLKDTEYDTGLDLKKMEEAAEILKEKRKKYKKFESEYNRIDTRVLINQIPGGMISNMANQLKEQGALEKMDEVLEEVPRVRKDFGYPPLVTPSSQIVGTQATLNVLLGQRYKSITTETRNYIKGLYGKPPAPIDPELKKLVLSEEEPITCRPADLLPPELPKAREESRDFAKSDTDVISYAIFGQVAKQYMIERNEGNLQPEPLLTFEEMEAGERLSDEFNVTVHGETYDIKIEGVGHKTQDVRPFFIRVDGELKEVFVENNEDIESAANEQTTPKKAKKGKLPKASLKGHVTAPMPGNLTKLNVKVGDSVKKGDTIAIVEAMKMENEVHAPVDGVVEEIYAKEGMQVNPDDALMLIKE
ncbi:sodium-extruding oxaloacetate decarboxylase subunit alpha [Nitrosophilus alvini]|uniref:sodium-extruding oxaloacetate decarboxylase subunit alpha n=1 Tax=Nitrosophilus alvini TaxID=2714855 RepID=UPI00190CC684|nr:sodium-extruding oxaloacetate decarboxylase subunit alpha [Nitrosophilus alvini]